MIEVSVVATNHCIRDWKGALPMNLENVAWNIYKKSIDKYGLDNAQYESNVDTPQEVTASTYAFLA